MSISTVWRTHQGRKRRCNEDRVLVAPLGCDTHLLMVADGLGGQPGGEMAAELAVRTAAGYDGMVSLAGLKTLMSEVNQSILGYGDTHPEVKGLGTTTTVVLLKERQVLWAHVGDSRLYHYRHQERLAQVTRDQTMSETLYEQGKISKAQIKDHHLVHFLEQCVGEETMAPDFGAFTCRHQDMLLLATDGLHNMVPDQDIIALLNDPAPLQERAERLLNAALNAGGLDNVSFIICSCEAPKTVVRAVKR
jgi:serine/threonine protein phosphatase PrpC